MPEPKIYYKASVRGMPKKGGQFIAKWPGRDMELDVDVWPERDFELNGDKIKSYSVNWSCLGAQSPEMAIFYGKMLRKAANKAKALGKAHIGKPYM